MSADKTLTEIFNKWNELNEKAQGSLGNFDFDSLKKIRAEQTKIEDEVYEAIKKSELPERR